VGVWGEGGLLWWPYRGACGGDVMACRPCVWVCILYWGKVPHALRSDDRRMAYRARATGETEGLSFFLVFCLLISKGASSAKSTRKACLVVCGPCLPRTDRLYCKTAR
jgi:hypothetical protein